MENEQDQTATLVLRPAWRLWWGSWLLLLMTLPVAVAPARMLGLVPVDNGSALLSGVQWLAAGIAVFVVLRMLFQRYSQKFVVSPTGVERCIGIIARDNLRIDFGHVRSVGLRQSVVERLLGVGTLEFASAGTGEVDIVFNGIARPTDRRAQIEDRLRSRHAQAAVD